ncbi:hypothetical protein [Alloactinosynnema sp. L-07]|uniref:hypothetical protein n=1 Tax=Alloactinosynnema sp. L-07 TaxID=1653480 RepID=UPI0006B492D4|nr:hypothetical protein [Alloactinosynnema sp. L-07]
MSDSSANSESGRGRLSELKHRLKQMQDAAADEIGRRVGGQAFDTIASLAKKLAERRAPVDPVEVREFDRSTWADEPKSVLATFQGQSTDAVHHHIVIAEFKRIRPPGSAAIPLVSVTTADTIVTFPLHSSKWHYRPELETTKRNPTSLKVLGILSVPLTAGLSLFLLGIKTETVTGHLVLTIRATDRDRDIRFEDIFVPVYGRIHRMINEHLLDALVARNS